MFGTFGHTDLTHKEMKKAFAKVTRERMAPELREAFAGSEEIDFIPQTTIEMKIAIRNVKAAREAHPEYADRLDCHVLLGSPHESCPIDEAIWLKNCTKPGPWDHNGIIDGCILPRENLNEAFGRELNDDEVDGEYEEEE